VNIIIANKTKTVVQKMRGHTSLPIIGNFTKFLLGVVCPFFSIEKYTYTGRTLFFAIDGQSTRSGGGADA
jgi:hypothetical protein